MFSLNRHLTLLMIFVDQLRFQRANYRPLIVVPSCLGLAFSDNSLGLLIDGQFNGTLLDSSIVSPVRSVLRRQHDLVETHGSRRGHLALLRRRITLMLLHLLLLLLLLRAGSLQGAGGLELLLRRLLLLRGVERLDVGLERILVHAVVDEPAG